ncbi:MAG: PepSY-associated TM helix domain-containing protein [Pirellula sp.]
MAKSTHRWIAKWSRWLHIYLSMAALAAIFFFSATGLTLNHPDWFFREQTTTVERSMEPAWLKIDRPSPAGWDEVDFGHQVDKLSVVEYLRAEHKIAGRMTGF